jgi:hypothetical protein
MGWIKLSSIFILILAVIFLTLGGKEFFSYFDVEISKKNNSIEGDTQDSVDEEKLDQKARQQPDATKELKDDPWKDFN